MTGRVRESIERSMDRIVVGVDGSLTITARPDGLLSVEGYLDIGGGSSGCRGAVPLYSLRDLI
jgi:hypothetical protein